MATLYSVSHAEDLATGVPTQICSRTPPDSGVFAGIGCAVPTYDMQLARWNNAECTIASIGDRTISPAFRVETAGSNRPLGSVLNWQDQ